MFLLPVIDLLHGRVVRGIGGRRAEYRPIRSQLAADAAPASVAAALAGLGFREVYVADLDAIAGRAPARDDLRRIAECGLAMWLDAGLYDAAAARPIMDFAREAAVAGVIAGLESLAGPQALADLLEAVGAERLVFSLDLRDGRPIARADEWQAATPASIAAEVLAQGVRRMIVLDLARVGVGRGVGTESLCREIRRNHGDCQLVAGGGVASLVDIERLAQAGCDGVLVASALHDGRIGWAEIARMQAM